ncbi:MAG: cytoplasmic protein [Pseudomonadota bacterium]
MMLCFSKFVKLIVAIALPLLVADFAIAQSGSGKVPTRAIIVPKAPNNEGIPLPNTQTGLEEEPDINPNPDEPEPEAVEDNEPRRNSESEQPQSSDPSAPLPTIERDIANLPAPVRATRARILAAIETGEVENLRTIIGTGEDMTSLSIGGNEADPIDFLKEISGDAEGIEILAILKEVLETGYTRMDPGTDLELYVWPYFFGYPLDRLTAAQRVELFTIMTAGEVLDSEEFGSYIFYRIGIAPDGQWAFFVSGD